MSGGLAQTLRSARPKAPHQNRRPGMVCASDGVDILRIELPDQEWSLVTQTSNERGKRA